MIRGLQIIRVVCALGVFGTGLFTLLSAVNYGLQDHWSVIIHAAVISSSVVWVRWELSRGKRG
jgi:hypothetical protein